MDEFKIGQLTKELVAEKLRRMDDPCAEAARLVRKTLGVALRNAQPGTEIGLGPVIEDACWGGMTALLLAEQSLSKGAVLVIHELSELATELQLDPTETLRSALRGIAGLDRVLRADQLDEIRAAIKLSFVGMDEAFAQIVEDERERRREKSVS